MQQTEFKRIYDNHASMVFNLCLNYLSNAEEAEECAQDVFLKVYNSIDSFEGKSSIKTWIYRITINTSLDYLKKRQRKKWLPFFSNHKELEVVEFNHPGIELEDKEAVQNLMNLMHELPENQRTAILLKSIEGLQQSEIAEVMQITVKSAESLLSRAKNNLKKKLNEGIE